VVVLGFVFPFGNFHFTLTNSHTITHCMSIMSKILHTGAGGGVHWGRVHFKVKSPKIASFHIRIQRFIKNFRPFQVIK
jgi:hypothetical protein